MLSAHPMATVSTASTAKPSPSTVSLPSNPSKHLSKATKSVHSLFAAAAVSTNNPTCINGDPTTAVSSSVRLVVTSRLSSPQRSHPPLSPPLCGPCPSAQSLPDSCREITSCTASHSALIEKVLSKPPEQPLSDVPTTSVVVTSTGASSAASISSYLTSSQTEVTPVEMPPSIATSFPLCPVSSVSLSCFSVPSHVSKCVSFPEKDLGGNHEPLSATSVHVPLGSTVNLTLNTSPNTSNDVTVTTIAALVSASTHTRGLPESVCALPAVTAVATKVTAKKSGNCPVTTIKATIVARGESISLARRACASAKRLREEARLKFESQGPADHDADQAAFTSLFDSSAATRANVSQNKSKRNKRVKWTTDEVNALRDGVLKHGQGRWAVILRDYAHAFHPARISVDLKDKWRNLSKSQRISSPECFVPTSVLDHPSSGTTQSSSQGPGAEESVSEKVADHQAPIAFVPEPIDQSSPKTLLQQDRAIHLLSMSLQSPQNSPLCDTQLKNQGDNNSSVALNHKAPSNNYDGADNGLSVCEIISDLEHGIENDNENDKFVLGNPFVQVSKYPTQDAEGFLKRDHKPVPPIEPKPYGCVQSNSEERKIYSCGDSTSAHHVGVNSVEFRTPFSIKTPIKQGNENAGDHLKKGMHECRREQSNFVQGSRIMHFVRNNGEPKSSFEHFGYSESPNQFEHVKYAGSMGCADKVEKVVERDFSVQLVGTDPSCKRQDNNSSTSAEQPFKAQPLDFDTNDSLHNVPECFPDRNEEMDYEAAAEVTIPHDLSANYKHIQYPCESGDNQDEQQKFSSFVEIENNERDSTEQNSCKSQFDVPLAQSGFNLSDFEKGKEFSRNGKGNFVLASSSESVNHLRALMEKSYHSLQPQQHSDHEEFLGGLECNLGETANVMNYHPNYTDDAESNVDHVQSSIFTSYYKTGHIHLTEHKEMAGYASMFQRSDFHHGLCDLDGAGSSPTTKLRQKCPNRQSKLELPTRPQSALLYSFDREQQAERCQRTDMSTKGDDTDTGIGDHRAGSEEGGEYVDHTEPFRDSDDKAFDAQHCPTLEGAHVLARLEIDGAELGGFPLGEELVYEELRYSAQIRENQDGKHLSAQFQHGSCVLRTANLTRNSGPTEQNQDEIVSRALANGGGDVYGVSSVFQATTQVNDNAVPAERNAGCSKIGDGGRTTGESCSKLVHVREGEYDRTFTENADMKGDGEQDMGELDMDESSHEFDDSTVENGSKFGGEYDGEWIMKASEENGCDENSVHTISDSEEKVNFSGTDNCLRQIGFSSPLCVDGQPEMLK